MNEAYSNIALVLDQMIRYWHDFVSFDFDHILLNLSAELSVSSYAGLN